MIAASGWADGEDDLLPLYDPCCGSGTMPLKRRRLPATLRPGSRRRFAFEKYLPFRRADWDAMKREAADAEVVREPGQKAHYFWQ